MRECNKSEPIIDIIPLHRVFGTSAEDILYRGAQGGYLKASIDERCDDCGSNPSDWLFDCDDLGTLCMSCADKKLPEQMQKVREINNIS
jgi:hypothetical protein